MIDWLLAHGIIQTRMEGVLYGQQLLMGRVLHHVTNEHHFTEASVYFYRFHEKYQPDSQEEEEDSPLEGTPLSMNSRS
jgi:membrane-associated HD superfamily phosphohydrolase